MPPTSTTGASPDTSAQLTPKEFQRNATLPSRPASKLVTRELRLNDWFEEVAHTVGVDFSYSDGGDAGFYQLLESVGGGVTSVDFDLDGWQDLFLTGGGKMQSNDGQLQSSGCGSGLFYNYSGSEFINIGEKACLLDESLYTHGCTVADLDADGFPDVLVAGYQGVRAWMNQGDGTFAERAAQLGIDSPNWNVVPAAADYDNDGLVDVYVFRNTGERFENVTNEVQLVRANRGLGIVAVDIDANGRIDFAVVNDVQENQCYFNFPEGPFREQGVLAGMAYSSTGEREGSMGINVGDFNRDGWPDLWYTNYANQDNSLMSNIHGSGFVNKSDAAGMGGVS
ncbi:MAG: VCBS repeat-containing protein, partial [Planctomycetia bacterium]|nr:VCBS repeat-containing protein [Planctomycetia bacterium]